MFRGQSQKQIIRLINQLMAAACLVWENPGDLPEQVTYLDLITVLHEMGTWQMTFAVQYHSPDKDLLTAHMKDIILASRLAGTLGSGVTLLAPFTDCPICDAVAALASLGNMKIKCQDK